MLLITVAGILTIGAAGEAVFERTQVADVLWLILAGTLLGPVSGLVKRRQSRPRST